MTNHTLVLILFLILRNIIISGLLYYIIRYNYENKPKNKFFLKIYNKNKKYKLFLFNHRKLISFSYFLILMGLSLYFFRGLF